MILMVNRFWLALEGTVNNNFRTHPKHSHPPASTTIPLPSQLPQLDSLWVTETHILV